MLLHLELCVRSLGYATMIYRVYCGIKLIE
jgi:hypothetical protein